MPATKITELTAISTVNTTVDPLAIVDVSDTTQASSGTTKKITVSQIDAAIFGSSGSKAIVVDNVAALKALTVSGIADGQLYITRGYYSDNDGGQGTYIYDTASSTSDNGGTVIAPTSGSGRFLLQTNGVLNVKQFGAKTDGSNSFAAFQSALSSVTSKSEIVVPSGEYVIGSGLSINVSLIKIVGQNAKLNFSSISTSSTALTITGSGSGSPYYQADGGIEGLEIVGPGTSGTSIGLFIGTATESGPSHCNIVRCVIRNFSNGVSFGNNAYLINFDNCDIHTCDIGVKIPSSITNSGEGLRFVDCTIYNNLSWGVYQDCISAFLKLIGTSVDYNGQGLYVNKGRVDLLGAHFEANGPGDKRHIYVPSGNTDNDAVVITISGGLYYRGANAVACTAPIIDLQGYAKVTITGAEIHDYATKSVVKVNNGTNSDIVWIGGRFVFDPAYTAFASAGSYNIRVKSFNSGRWSVSGIDSQSDFFAGSGVTANTGNITASGGNIVGLSAVAANGVFSNGEKSFALTALNTWTNIGTGQAGGLYVFRDATSGGMALFASDSSYGANSIYNNIGGFEMRWDSTSSQMQARVTSGTVTRFIKFAIIQTNAT